MRSLTVSSAPQFERLDLEEFIPIDKDYIGWANYLAPLVMRLNGEPMVEELADSFCSTDPITAKVFAKGTFLSDCQSMLASASQPTLILQSGEDVLAAISVGKYIQSAIQNVELDIISANGHCLHMTNLGEIATGINRFAID